MTLVSARLRQRHLNGRSRRRGSATPRYFGVTSVTRCPSRAKRQRQRAEHVGQAAGFGKRQRFGAHHQNREQLIESARVTFERSYAMRYYCINHALSHNRQT